MYEKNLYVRNREKEFFSNKSNIDFEPNFALNVSYGHFTMLRLWYLSLQYQWYGNRNPGWFTSNHNLPFYD